MSMVPQKFPAFPDREEVDVYATLQPAREVGGDLYDFYFLDKDRLCFCIADVSGKGVPAALFMAMTKTLIKSRSADDYSTASIVTHVNDELSEDNPQSMFVTLFLAILNVRTGELLYTNAGHNPSYTKRSSGSVEVLKELHGPIVGAMPGLTYKEASMMLKAGDMMLLYTDGVTEAMNKEDELYSDQRLDGLVERSSFESAQQLTEMVMADVVAFEDGNERADDITILALCFNGTSKSGSINQRSLKV
jgi:sigma-B regulation protein RsbU (phosphoserine phosphatase)